MTIGPYDDVPPFTADLDLVFPGEELPQAITLRGLLVRLGVENAGRVAQTAAVREWLAANEPNVNLRASIERSALLPDQPRPEGRP